MASLNQPIKIQGAITIVGFLLLGVKLTAYLLTHSVAILTDALESIVNVVAGLIALFALVLASKPKDASHPYGHGKVEFISAGIEGTLIALAGVFILIEAVRKWVQPAALHELSIGIVLIIVSGVINLIIGWMALKTGKKYHSAALSATGKHLLSDAMSTAALVLGLIILQLTGWVWVDSAVAFLFGAFIIFTGWGIVRSSLAGIMDEADEALLTQMVSYLGKNRSENWIDLHNFRVIKYGNTLHVDSHLTLPWYLNIHESHYETDALDACIKKEFGDAIELFIHTDGCQPFSCPICSKKKCSYRQQSFQKQILWTVNNLSKNVKHELAAS